MNDDARDVISRAEQIVHVARWRLLEVHALRSLASTRGLARARLDPRSDAIQLVTFDGEHLGHVRRADPSGSSDRWVAVPMGEAQSTKSHDSAEAAAHSLARVRGRIR